MRTFQHALRNLQTGTPPPRHMAVSGYTGKRETINLDLLAARCIERGVDVNDIIAEALTLAMREEMGIKAQADLAWKILDKLEASKKAIEHSGNAKAPVTFVIEG